MDKIREAIMSEFVRTFDPTPNGQEVNGEWYAPKWGCDTLDQILENVAALFAPMASDARELAAKVRKHEFRATPDGTEIVGHVMTPEDAAAEIERFIAERERKAREEEREACWLRFCRDWHIAYPALGGEPPEWCRAAIKEAGNGF